MRSRATTTTSSSEDPQTACNTTPMHACQYRNPLSCGAHVRPHPSLPHEAAPAASRSDQVFDRGLQRVREYLGCSQEEGGACLICLGLIKPSEAVWDCKGGCYAVMHLNCIQVRGCAVLPSTQTL